MGTPEVRRRSYEIEVCPSVRGQTSCTFVSGVSWSLGVINSVLLALYELETVDVSETVEVVRRKRKYRKRGEYDTFFFSLPPTTL